MKFTKRLSSEERKRLAVSVRTHRRMAFERPSITYSIFRGLSEVRQFLGLDLASVVDSKIKSRHHPIHFLDSGAGALRVSAGLKKRFGDKINITTLSLKHPNASTFTRKQVFDKIRADLKESKYYSKKDLVASLKKHSRLLAEAKKNVKSVDYLHVGLAENFKSRKKFDIIFDYSGPLSGGFYTGEVFSNYSQLLKKGGILITCLSPIELEYTAGNQLAEFTVRPSAHYCILVKN